MCICRDILYKYITMIIALAWTEHTAPLSLTCQQNYSMHYYTISYIQQKCFTTGFVDSIKVGVLISRYIMHVIIQDRRSHLKAEYHHQSKLSWQIWVICHVILMKRLKRICNKRLWKFLSISPEQVIKISPLTSNGIFFSITQTT